MTVFEIEKLSDEAEKVEDLISDHCQVIIQIPATVALAMSPVYNGDRDTDLWLECSDDNISQQWIF